MTFSSGIVQSSVNLVALPTASTSQEVHIALVNYTTSATYYQVATPDATHDVYLLGYHLINDAAVSPVMAIFDAASGNVPTITANTMYTDEENQMYYDNLAVVGERGCILKYPYKVTNGIRLKAGGTSANGAIRVFYMVVTK